AQFMRRAVGYTGGKEMRKKKPSSAEFYILRVVIIGLALTIIGFLLVLNSSLFASDTVRDSLRHIGVTLVVIGMLSVLYDVHLRESFLKVVRETMSDVIDEKAPENFGNIRRAGLMNAYECLDVTKFKERLERAQDSEIKILK